MKNQILYKKMYCISYKGTKKSKNTAEISKYIKIERNNQ